MRTVPGRVDKTAVRNTQDVDILLRREDFNAAKVALEAAGFVCLETACGVDVFFDGSLAKAREAVHVTFANEKVRPDEALANPDLIESETAERFRVLSLEALVRVKLTAFRDEDRVHLRDLIGVGLVDSTWPARFPSELSARLQSLLDTPGG